MNTFGNAFRVSIFGESHGPCIGVTVDGCPAGIPLTEDDFTRDLGRRKAGATGTTPRVERDEPRIVSGVFNDFTTGAPLTILFDNENVQSSDYARFNRYPRPSHADFVAVRKFDDFADYRGGGHFSGRLTLPLVAAGVVAKKVISPMSVQASVVEIGGETAPSAWLPLLEKMRAEKDSVGGIVACTASHIPIGLGEPFFDSAEALISHLMFSIPAVKAVEFGSGFGAARMKGSEHNDVIVSPDGTTRTNHAGGIVGGITNGNDLVFRIAVKPTASIGKEQDTISLDTGAPAKITIKGRHDVCIALRVPPVVEACTAIALADLFRR
ncbi:MAG: chorismate synthase [Bacteroidales bacterium]|nr:chorismate synthase [Bacteroidales bacterium]